MMAIVKWLKFLTTSAEYNMYGCSAYIYKNLIYQIIILIMF